MARYRTFAEHLDPAVGPKRILALDGGGLRGVLTLGMLREIETTLRARHGGDPDFRLSDYFDLMAGTSTGAIIAAALSLGMSGGRGARATTTGAGRAWCSRAAFLRTGVLRAKYDGRASVKDRADWACWATASLDSADFKHRPAW